MLFDLETIGVNKKVKKYALNSQLQALQILTNDEEVENWSLSSFLLAVQTEQNQYNFLWFWGNERRKKNKYFAPSLAARLAQKALRNSTEDSRIPEKNTTAWRRTYVPVALSSFPPLKKNKITINLDSQYDQSQSEKK